MNEWEFILKLTDYEGNSVTIIADNADYEGEKCAVGLLTIPMIAHGLEEIIYYGDTKLQCLKKAYDDYSSGDFSGERN